MTFIIALSLCIALFVVWINEDYKSHSSKDRFESEQDILKKFERKFENADAGNRIDAMLYDVSKRDDVTIEVEEVFNQIPQLNGMADDWYVVRPGYSTCNKTLVSIILKANRGVLGWNESYGYASSTGYAYVDEVRNAVSTMPLNRSTLNKFCEIISEKMISKGSQCRLIHKNVGGQPMFVWVQK